MAKDHSILSTCKSIPYYPHANLYPIIPMQIYTLLSPCKPIPYYPHANLYPIIPMQICTLLSPWHDNPPFQCSLYLLLTTLHKEYIDRPILTEQKKTILVYCFPALKWVGTITVKLWYL